MALLFSTIHQHGILITAMQIFSLFIVRDKCVGPLVYPPLQRNEILSFKVILLKKLC